MKESEVFERSNSIHLINNLVAPQASRFIEIWPIHHALNVFLIFLLSNFKQFPFQRTHTICTRAYTTVTTLLDNCVVDRFYVQFFFLTSSVKTCTYLFFSFDYFRFRNGLFLFPDAQTLPLSFLMDHTFTSTLLFSYFICFFSLSLFFVFRFSFCSFDGLWNGLAGSAIYRRSKIKIQINTQLNKTMKAMGSLLLFISVNCPKKN